MQRPELVRVAKDTLSALKNKAYTLPNGNEVNIGSEMDKAIAGTKLYRPDDFAELEACKSKAIRSSKTRIHVSIDGTIQAASKLSMLGEANIACLNFASATRPGGGFLSGAKAQEEDISRVSGLYPCLLQCDEYYKVNNAIGSAFYTDHMIYSPNVPVIRNEYGQWLDSPHLVSIITAPAPMAKLLKEHEPDSLWEIPDIMSSRIDKVLTLAVAHGHRSLILGAWGCGAFGNDPILVSKLFKIYLNGPFKNMFDHVVFALYDRTQTHPNTVAFLSDFTETCDICV